MRRFKQNTIECISLTLLVPSFRQQQTILQPHLAEWLGGRPSGQWTEVRNPLAGVELLAAATSDPRESCPANYAFSFGYGRGRVKTVSRGHMPGYDC